jgi:hypothetical protein
MIVAQHLSQFLARLATDPDQLAAYLNDRDATIAAAGLDPHDADALCSGDAAAIQRRLAAGAAQLSGSVHVPSPPEKEPVPSVHVPPPPSKEPMPSVHVPSVPSREPTPSVHVPSVPSKEPVPSVHVPEVPSKEPVASVHVPSVPSKEPVASVHVPPPPTASVHVPPPPEAVPPSRRT